MAQRVVVWTAPRCVSTAFERSIREIKNSLVFHEPYYKAYFIGPERISGRYKNKPADSSPTFKSTSQALLEKYGEDGVEVVFVKEMAYHVLEHFSDGVLEGFRGFKHSFLIRDPRKSIRSLFKNSVKNYPEGMNHFDATECGFQEMLVLYDFLVKELGESPVVVDAGELLENPEGIMRAYCEATGIPFSKDMLEWEPGPVADWGIWPGWHDNIIQSSGFKRRGEERKEKDAKEEEQLPDIVMQAIEKCMPIYQQFYEKRIMPKS